MFRIVSVSDPTLCLSVPARTNADRSPVCLQTIGFYDDTNQQLWSQIDYSGYIHIRNYFGAILDAKGGVSQQGSGQLVDQYRNNDTLNQRWNIIPDNDSVEINGYSYETCNIACYSATSVTPTTYLLTCQPMGGKQAYLDVPTVDDTQRWAIIDDTKHYNGFTLRNGPSSFLAYYTGTSASFTVNLRQSQAIRYRIRYHGTLTDEWGEWGDWASMVDSSKECWGWSTDTPTEASVPVSLETSQDAAEIEYETRVTTSEAHSSPYSFTARLVRGWDIDNVTASLFPDGMVIDWASDMPREGTAAIYLDGQYWQQVSYDGVLPDDSVTYPQDKLAKAYRTGDEIRVHLVLSDGIYTKNGNHTVTLGTSIADTITLTPVVDGTTVSITCDDSTAQGWLEIPRGHGVRYIELGTPPYTVYPPLNVEWTVYAHGRQGYAVETYPAIEDKAYHITSQDGEHDCAITLNAGNNPGLKATYKRSRDDHDTYGRERPVYGFQASTSVSWSIEGVVFGEYGSLDEVDWLAHASHVLLRTPQGDWCQCAVSSVSIDKTPAHYAQVSISLDEEVW